ncbi:hypothetical protein LINPERHAP1_LOCUS41089 [Linum perenne]
MSAVVGHRHLMLYRAGQLGFHGLRSYSIICRMALQQRLLPIMHGRTRGFL